MGRPWAILLLACLCLVTTVGQSHAFISEIEKDALSILKNLVPADYCKSIRPNYGGPPVTVTVSMYILELKDISEKTMDYTIQLYFRHLWNDSRLAYSPKGRIDTVLLPDDLAGQIWTPDTFFSNGRQVKFTKLTMTGKDAQFIRVKSNGEVFMSRMIEIVASCPMYLGDYPFDTQRCRLEFESYGYAMSDINYTWRTESKPVTHVSSRLAKPGFSIASCRTSNATERLSSGNYSRLIVHLDLARNRAPYIWNVYLPTFFLVLVSFLPLCFTQLNGYIRLALLLALFLLSVHWNLTIHSQMTTIGSLLGCYLMASTGTILLGLVTLSLLTFFSKNTEYSLFKSPSDDKLGGSTGCRPDRWVRWILPGLYLLYNFLHLVRIAQIVSK